MQNLSNLRSRLSTSRIGKPPVPTIDLSLADPGDIEPNSTYIGRIISARFIHSSTQERTDKIDICIELLNIEGQRLGILNDYLFLSVRSMRRLKEFLIAAEIVTEGTAKTFCPPADALCEMLLKKMIGVVTKESLLMTQDDGSPVIEIASYISAEAAAEQYTDEQGEGQD